MVLLQSCEQVPKRRHSLMSGGYMGGSWRNPVWLGFLPVRPGSGLPTLASGLAWHGVEARAAGTVGSVLRAHAACFIPTDARVGGTAGQLGVCGGERVDPFLQASLGLGFGSLPPSALPAASARPSYRCCSPPHQSRPRSHRTCCSAARRRGSAGSGTETPSCLCSGRSEPWRALGRAGASGPPYSPPCLPPPPMRTPSQLGIQGGPKSGCLSNLQEQLVKRSVTILRLGASGSRRCLPHQLLSLQEGLQVPSNGTFPSTP